MKTNSIEKYFTIQKILKIDFQNFDISWKGSKSISWIFLGSETQWNYRETRISWNALKETFHSVSSPIENNSFHEDNSNDQVIENANDLFISDHETPLPQVTLHGHRKLFYGGEGRELSKNVSHHGPTKKDWLNNPIAKIWTNFELNLKRNLNFGHTKFLYLSRRSRGRNQRFFLISKLLVESLRNNKN